MHLSNTTSDNRRMSASRATLMKDRALVIGNALSLRLHYDGSLVLERAEPLLRILDVLHQTPPRRDIDLTKVHRRSG